MRGRPNLTKRDIAALVLCGVLLISSLGAVGQTGRNRAKEFVCLANVRQLSLAWLAYTQDNDGRLVEAMVMNSIYTWAHPVPSGGVGADEEIDQAIKTGAFYPYVGEVRVYRCPADPRMKDPRRAAYRSYSIANGANGEKSWPDGGNDHTPAQRYDQIENPSRKYVFLEDADPRGSNVGSWQMHFLPLSWIDPLAMWHGERTTFGFADGHSESHKWANRSTIDWCYRAMYEPAMFSFNMTPPADEREDIEYMAAGFPCKDHR